MERNGFFTKILNYFFPPFCLVCGTRTPGEGSLVCFACFKAIELIGAPSCTRCGKPFLTAAGDDHVCGECLCATSTIDSVRALGTYDGTLRSIIQLIKYQGKFAALAVIDRLFNEQSVRFSDFIAYDVIVPVPLHKRRLRERGFNQAVAWGHVVGRKLGVPVDVHALCRTRWTVPQVKLRGMERRNNVRNAFSVEKPLKFNNAAVLLVDDVYTTGATMNECARVLREAGASRINGLVIARAV